MKNMWFELGCTVTVRGVPRPFLRHDSRPTFFQRGVPPLRNGVLWCVVAMKGKGNGREGKKKEERKRKS